jgi:hypothetical protein
MDGVCLRQKRCIGKDGATRLCGYWDGSKPTAGCRVYKAVRRAVLTKTFVWGENRRHPVRENGIVYVPEADS